MEGLERVVARGVTLHPCFWGFYLEGKKEDLIACGIAQEQWFAKPRRNERGQIRRSMKFHRWGRLIETTLPARGPATVCVHFTQREEHLSRVDLSKRPELHEKLLSVVMQGADSYQRLSLGMIPGVEADVRRLLNPRNEGEALALFRARYMFLAHAPVSRAMLTEVSELYAAGTSDKVTTSQAPFSAEGGRIRNAAGKYVAICDADELASAIVNALNRELPRS